MLLLPVMILEGACVFAFLLWAVGFILLLHHGYKHMDDPPETSLAKKESRAEFCYFQLSDISNHETWIVVCWTNAFTILTLVNLNAS